MTKLNEQTIVITGASSGIGRETALRAAQQGANVVLAGRNSVGLEEVAQEIHEQGGKAHVVLTDVSDFRQVQHLAEEALSTFGRIDTWVNNAGVSVYATVDQTEVDEIARLFQVNFMGVVHGVKAVLPIMKRQEKGTIINIGSVASVRALPLQAAYSASKHAVKGFTEALRLELKRNYPRIRVTLIMPASVNTPFFQHARSKLDMEPQPVPPVYPPHLVADTILHAAQHPTRDIMVGGMAKMLTFMQKIDPALVDFYMLQNGRIFKQQLSRQPATYEDNLDNPMLQLGTTQGEWGEMTVPDSPITRLEYYPVLKRLLTVLGVVGLFTLVRRVGRA